MKTISGKEFSRLLEKRGWTLERQKGSHKVYSPPAGNPRKSIPVPVHGNKDLGKGMQRKLMKLAGITDADL